MLSTMLMAMLIITLTTVVSFSPCRRQQSSQLVPKLMLRDAPQLYYMHNDASNTALFESRAVKRESAVQPIRTMKQYEAFVLDETEKLVIIRFHAPWCRVCKGTDVAYERYATKIQRAYPQKVQFCSVNFDGKEETTTLKDTLLEAHGIDIREVPVGLLFHPQERGIVGKVKLNRKHLSSLKDKVAAYLEGGADLISLLNSWVP